MKAQLVGMLALITVACGGSTTAPQSNSSGSPSSPGGGNTTTPHISVSITEYSFGPSDITIAKGATVTWTNDGTLAHTVTANGFGSGQLAPPVGSGGYGMTSGQTYSMSFSTPGTYAYHCSNHPQMTGMITVTN